MNIYEYQSQALQTAIYPLERALDYTVFGLLSEVGELAEWVLWSDDYGKPYWEKNWKSELGDCHWYTVAIADALGKSLGNIQEDHVALRASIQMELEGRDTNHVYAELVGATGRLAGYMKKTIRDTDGVMGTDKRGQFERSLVIASAMLELLGTLHNMPVKQVWNANLNKLADRKSRNVLKGSGDNR